MRVSRRLICRLLSMWYGVRFQETPCWCSCRHSTLTCLSPDCRFRDAECFAAQRMSRRLTCRLLSMMVPFLISGDPLLVPTHVQKAHLPVVVHVVLFPISGDPLLVHMSARALVSARVCIPPDLPQPELSLS